MTIRKFFSLSMRVLFATALTAAFAFSLVARPVDVHSAKRIAEGFFQSQGAQLRAGEEVALHLEAVAMRTADKHFALLTTGDPLLRSSISTAPASFYVFNRGEGHGYAIVAGDDMLTPIVGYSLSGHVNLKDAPSYLVGFFEKVSHAIEYALQSGDPIVLQEMAPTRPQSVRSALPTSVAPLLGEIEWDQTFPWNKQCPEVKTETGAKVKAPVGCVATAMVQIMRFHEWPTRGQGKSSYTDIISGNFLSADYGSTTYDFSLMPKNKKGGQFTEAEQDEVAKISSHAGISVEMSYGANASGAYSFNVGKAFRDYFRYDKKSMILPRDAFSTDEWYGHVYGDLAAGLPVYYAGSGTGGGHAFVFDGYDKDGNIHVNWGWSGVSNGYFNMNILNPSALGTGGGTGGGFNYSQESSINLKPDKDGTSIAPNAYLFYDGFLVNVDTDQKAIDLRSLRCFVYDHTYINGAFAIAAEPFEGGEMVIGATKVQLPTIEFGRSYTYDDLKETCFSTLKDGYYLIHPVYKTTNNAGEEVWEPFRYLVLYKGNSPIRHTLIKVSEGGTKWERVDDIDRMERTAIVFNTNKATGDSFLFKANGVASAKQSGLEEVPVLNGAEQKLVLKDNKVSIEGFFNTLTLQNAGITELFLNAAGSLTKLDIRNNEVGYLNAGHMPLIDSLDISYNNLSVITLDGCEKLQYINVTGNPLDAYDVAEIIAKLPARPANAKGRFVMREISDNPRANAVWAYVSDVRIATGKNWWVMTYNPETKLYDLYKGVPAATDEIAEGNAPKLYPTPATDMLYLSGIEAGVEVRLYTLSGELVRQQEAKEGTNILAVGEFPRGQYFLVAGDFTGKVLLQNAK